jgi:hypothetical protein
MASEVSVTFNPTKSELITLTDSEAPACHAATEGAEAPNIFFNDEFPPIDGFCLEADDEGSSGNWEEVSLGSRCDFFEEFEVDR